MINANGLRDVIIQTLQGCKHEDDPQTKFAEAVAKYYRDNLTLGGTYSGMMFPPATSTDPLSGSYTIEPLLMTINASELKNAAKNGYKLWKKGYEAWYMNLIEQIHNFTFKPTASNDAISGAEIALVPTIIKPMNGIPIAPSIKDKENFEDIMGIVASCIIRDTVSLPPLPPAFSATSSSGTGALEEVEYK